MHVDNELINQFLTGTISVFVMVLIGGSLAHLLRSINKRFAFTKTALVLALPPLCFSLCVDRGGLSTIYLFAIVVILLGFSIDGIKHLLPTGCTEDESPPGESRPSGSESGEKQVIWEKVD
jgi:hypothetical protein